MRPSAKETIASISSNPDYQLRSRRRKNTRPGDIGAGPGNDEVVVYYHFPTRTFWAKDVADHGHRGEVGDWYQVEQRPRDSASAGVDFVEIVQPVAASVEVPNAATRAEPRDKFTIEGRLTDEFVRWLTAGGEPSAGWFAYLRILANETMEHRGLTLTQKTKDPQ